MLVCNLPGSARSPGKDELNDRHLHAALAASAEMPCFYFRIIEKRSQGGAEMPSFPFGEAQHVPADPGSVGRSAGSLANAQVVVISPATLSFALLPDCLHSCSGKLLQGMGQASQKEGVVVGQ